MTDIDVHQAFAAALNEVQQIAKTETADTGKYTYSYASLGMVLEEVKRVCQAHGLSVSQNATTIEQGGASMLAITTTLLQTDTGDSLAFDPICIRCPVDPQPLGSAMTYLRRYALLTIFAIATEDDDAKQAHQAVVSPPPVTARTQAEALMRQHIESLEPADVKAVRAAFKEQFGTTLAQLPKSQHDEALTWFEDFLGIVLVDAEVGAESPYG